MKATPLSFSLWVTTCVSIGLGMHYHDHGDIEAVMKTAITFAIIMVSGYAVFWGWQKLRR